MKTMVAATVTRSSHPHRRSLAASRLEAARAALAECVLCQHRCAVDRRQHPGGRCGAGPAPRAFSVQTEVGDERELIPTAALALSGCSMRCAFCITGEESWHADRGRVLDAASAAAWASREIASGAARTVQILGGEPTVHLPWLLEFVAGLSEDARIVLKTNGLCTAVTRSLLDGLIDVWLVDYKFGTDACAAALSRTRAYRAAVEETLVWAAARADLIVRHLVMPGHVECCWRPVAAWIAERLPAAKVSLRFGYWPAWKARGWPGLGRPLSEAEQQQAAAVATAHHLNLIT